MHQYHMQNTIEARVEEGLRPQLHLSSAASPPDDIVTAPCHAVGQPAGAAASCPLQAAGGPSAF